MVDNYQLWQDRWARGPETIPTWMLSEEGRDRVKQRQSIQPVGDAGDMDESDGGEQATGEPPTRGARGGVRPDSMILEGWRETSPPPQGPSKRYTHKPQTSGNDLKMKTPRYDESR